VSNPEGEDHASERDENPSGPRPNPLDRSWVHPSELHSFVPNPLPEPQARPREWVIGVVSAAVGAAAVLLVLVAFGALGESNRSSIPPPVVTNPNQPIDFSTAFRVNNERGPSVVGLRVGDNTVGAAVAVQSNRVMTSAHLLGDTTSLAIVTADNRVLPAKVLGSDTATDLALLDVPNANLAFAPLSRSDATVGEPVVALASSKGGMWLGMGIISQDNQLAQYSNSMMAGLLQASIGGLPAEPSGGALFDADGYLLGILTTPPGVTTSGLAVPVSAADDVRRQIEATGKVSHGWLGVSVEDSPAPTTGARITAVAPDGPAQGNLGVGDVVTRADGVLIATAGDLIAQWRKGNPGDEVELAVNRGRETHTVKVTLAADPANSAPPPAAPASDH
jgi:S1-C subfamily serine protease